MTHTVLLFDLFVYVDASICSTVVFPPLGNSYHVVISASIYFLSNSKLIAPFHRTVFDYKLSGILHSRF